MAEDLYIEHETIALTRKPGFPASLIVGPIINAGPKEGVGNALEAIRRALNTADHGR